MVDRFVIQLKFTFVHFLQFWVFRRHGSFNFVLVPFKDQMNWLASNVALCCNLG